MKNVTATILSLDQIEKYLRDIDSIPLIETGFVEYSNGSTVIPPVGELLFENPPGDTHIKYGYIKGQQYFAVKIASGFSKNTELGIKSSQGVILLFSQRTGELKCVLLDDGLLTDVRTAVASMITIKYLAPNQLSRIGIIGTGIQAKLQLDYLHTVTACKNVVVWGRTLQNAHALKKEYQDNYKIKVAETARSLAQQCQVIITTTSSTSPLIQYDDLNPGTHITALGSDTSSKVELDPEIIKQADVVVSDSIAQSMHRGEVYQARSAGALKAESLIELGNLIQNPMLGRKNDQQISVADLTGVAVQDIMIATAVFERHLIDQ